MADDVVKQAATEDDLDAYSESLQTNTRLMVSPYSGTLNYVPHQQYPHLQHQSLQHLATPAADKRWLDVTTIVGISTEEDSGCGYTISCAGDRHVQPAVLEDAAVVTGSTTRQTPVCAAHMYESPRFQ